MPAIRRYIRISPYSLLETRIFLENPADGPRWLLSRTSPALPAVFDAVRPLILPKLREERERTAATKGKGKKGRSVKDVVEREGFRVVVFLTDGVAGGGGRHEVVVKVKRARERDDGKGKGRGKERVVVVREEEDSDGDVDLRDVPMAEDGEEEDEGDEFVELGSRRRRGVEEMEDKKKLGFDTRYEGFSIWGKVLCLLVERKGGPEKKSMSKEGNEGAQKVMQEWISSTQVGAEDDDG